MDANQILEKLGKVGGFAASALSAMVVTFQEAIAKAEAEGYERGFADGERAAREELQAFKRRLAGIIESEEIIKPVTIENEGQLIAAEKVYPPHGGEPFLRAPRGSVAPAVINALKSTSRGMNPKEVADAAHIPENSARGSLNKLRHEGVVEKRGALWFLTNKNEWTAENSAAH